jgi:hypothetical protein
MPISLDPIPVFNTTLDVIPGFALMKRMGVNGVGQLTVALPDTDGQLVIVNGPCVIPPGQVGLSAGYGPRCIIAYDPQDGTPATDDTWGAAAGQWTARKDKAGFAIDGGAAGGVVNAVRIGSDVSTSGFHARLTSSLAGHWKFVPLTLDASGNEIDGGSETPEYAATPLSFVGAAAFNTTTTASLTVPAVSASVTASVGTTSWMVVGQSLNFTNGTNAFTGTITATGTGTVTIICTAITSGAAGNTLASGAAVYGPADATSGDRVWMWPSKQSGFFEFVAGRDFKGSGTNHSRGLVPDPGPTAGATRYLREDATWDVPPGTYTFDTTVAITAPLDRAISEALTCDNAGTIISTVTKKQLLLGQNAAGVVVAVSEGTPVSTVTNLFLVNTTTVSFTTDAATGDISAIVTEQVLSKSGSYTLADADRGKLVYFVASATLTVPDPGATFAANWYCDVEAGTGPLTISRQTAATIDGVTSLNVPTGQGVRLVSDGTNWKTQRGLYTPPVTAKGDIFTYSTLPDRLAVGANGDLLSADSTQSVGLRWIPPTSTTTTANLTVPGVGGSVTASVVNSGGMVAGEGLMFADGANTFYGQVTAIPNSTSVTVTGSSVTSGAVGNTLAAGALVAPSAPAVVGPVPSSPAGLTATGQVNQVALNWTSVPGSVTRIYRSTTSGGSPWTVLNKIADVATGSSTYTDTSVTDGTTYYYVVSAVTSGGAESALSSQVSATPFGNATASSWPGTTGTPLPAVANGNVILAITLGQTTPTAPTGYTLKRGGGDNNGVLGLGIYYKISNGTETTFKFTGSGLGNFSSVIFVLPKTGYDKDLTSGIGTNAAPSVGASGITPSTAADIAIWACCVANNTGSTISVPSGFVDVPQQSLTDGLGDTGELKVGYQQLTSGSAITGNYTGSISSSQDWGTVGCLIE